MDRKGQNDLPNLFRLRETTNTPNTTTEAVIRYADGTSWDPGSGKGYYFWDGSTWIPMFGAGGGGGTPVQIDEYTTPGADTWTKPTGAVAIQFELIGAGAGGDSGARGATSTFVPGGVGGGGGAYYCATFLAAEVDATVDVYVGAGGTGGAARTTDNTACAGGTDGEDSYISDTSLWVCAYGGKAGVNGVIGGAAGTGGAGGQSGLGDTGNHSDYYATYDRHTNPITVPFTVGPFGGPGLQGSFGASADRGGGAGGGCSNDGQLLINSGSSLANAGFAGGGSMYGGGGGGGGGSISSANTAQRGAYAGKHGWMQHQLRTGSTAGSGAAGAAGTVVGDYPMQVSDGGGGGDASTSGAGGAGGSAARGGGGGGGGASNNGNNSGAGGDGGDGYIRITTWF